jgi:hypothetical protein
MNSESIGVKLGSPLGTDSLVGEPAAAPGPDQFFVLLLIEPTPEDRLWPAALVLPLVRGWATQGRSILLIDGDVVEPTLHRALGLPNREGLSDFLAFGASEGRVVQLHPEVPFRFLSAGNLWADAPALFRSHRWTALLDRARERGELVVLFLPLDRLAPSPRELDPQGIALLNRADLRLMVNRPDGESEPNGVDRTAESNAADPEVVEGPEAAPVPPPPAPRPVYGAKRTPSKATASRKKSSASRLFIAFLLLVVLAMAVVAIQMGMIQIPGLEGGIPGLPRLP